MDTIKTVITKKWLRKWLWLACAVAVAFLVFHAPRIALSIPFM